MYEYLYVFVVPYVYENSSWQLSFGPALIVLLCVDSGYDEDEIAFPRFHCKLRLMWASNFKTSRVTYFEQDFPHVVFRI